MKNLQFERHKLSVDTDFFSIWHPHKGQVPVMRAMFQDWVSGIFLKCGRKWSKTELCIASAYLMAMYFPGSHIYYIGPTMKHAGELIWHNRRLPDFFTNLKKYPDESEREFALRREHGKKVQKKWVKKSNNSEMRTYLTNGSWIKVDGADNFGNANGMNPHFIMYDEFKLHDPRFHEAMEPNLTTNRAPIMIVGTPPEGTDSYYTKIENDFRSEEGYQFFNMPSYMNDLVFPGGEQDEYFIKTRERYERRNEMDIFEREYLAKTVKGGHRAIFPNFESPEIDYDNDGGFKDYTRHVRPHSEMIEKIASRHKDWEFFCSYDAGTVICFAVLFGAINKYTKEVLILNEIYETNQSKTTTRQIYPRSVEIMKEIHSDLDDWTKVYDNAAAWFAAEVAQEYNEGILPCTKDIRIKESRLGMIKDLLEFEFIKLSERVPKLIWEMDNYYKNEKNKIPKENDHAIDCCFTGDTMVSTDSWQKRIEHIREGDYVLTREGYRRVDYVYDNGIKDIYILNSGLRLTLGHKIYTLNRGFVKVENLNKGDVLCQEKMVLLSRSLKDRFIKFGLTLLVRACVHILDVLKGKQESIIYTGKSGRV